MQKQTNSADNEQTRDDHDFILNSDCDYDYTQRNKQRLKDISKVMRAYMYLALYSLNSKWNALDSD